MPNEAPVTLENVSENVKGLYEILKSKTAPAQGGKPVFAKDIEAAGACGARTMADILGYAEGSTERKGVSTPLNYGSRASTGMLSDEVRTRLFALKKLYASLEVQTGFLNKGVVTMHTMQGSPLWKQFEAACKAFDVTDFSTWIPTVNSRFYFEEYEIPFILANAFDQLPMESAVVHVPGVLGTPEGKEEGDAATFTEQSNTSSGYDVHARNNVYHQRITEDLAMDSAPSIIEKLRKEGAAALARSYERAILNGDTTDSGTGRGSGHMDTDIAAVSKHFSKAFDGLRKKAMANSANGVIYDHLGAAPSKVLFENVMNALGIFASEKSMCKWVLGTSVANKLVTGAIPELFTAYAFGSAASNVTGQVPPVFGIQGIQSQYIREDLNATGVYQAGQSKTILICVRTDRFSNWVRQPMRQWATPTLANSDQMLLASKMRHAWAGNPQSATEKSVAMAINVASV